MIRLNVIPSSVIKQPFSDFIAILHPDKMKELKVHTTDYVVLENIIKTRDGKKSRLLKISSPLISSKNKLIDKEITNSITTEDISIDQTYREALGIHTNQSITIEIPKKRMGLDERLLDKMNYQKAIVRVQPNATYMERQTPIVCLCEEMINSIGAIYGDRIVIESYNKKIIVECAPLTPLMQKFHDYVSSPSSDPIKQSDREKEIIDYFDVPKNWGLESEVLLSRGDLIHPIFMDYTGRKSLSESNNLIPRLYPVKIRRSFRWDFLKKLNSFGAISLLALSVTAFGILDKPGEPIFWILSLLFGFWGAWSIITSSKYKTSVS